MPSGIISSFASRSGKSTGEVETLWNKAKAAAKKQLGTDSGDRFYKLTTGILKRMLKLETEVAVAAPTNTISTANIAPSQSGNFASKLSYISKRTKKSKKNEAMDLIENYGTHHR